MVATLKTTVIQEPSSSTANITLDSSGNVGVGTSTPKAQVHVFGSGQQTAALTDAGVRGGMLRVSDNSFAAGAGGAILFANSQGDTANSVGFAAIKGLLSDGTNNTAGAIAFSTRTSSANASLTEAMRITTAGAISVGSSGTATGTSGQVLTSAGSNAPPTWSTISANGGFVSQSLLTSGTTYTTGATTNRLLIQAWGGGGGSGGVQSGTVGGGGGGGGAYMTKYVTVTPSTTYTIAIGAAGNAGINGGAQGGAGGNTSITVGATTYTAGGGGGGNNAGGGANGNAGAGGTGTNGDINVSGVSGNNGGSTGGAGGYVRTYWNYPQASGSSAGAGQAGQYYGGGAGGSANTNATNGAAGYQGAMIITEYT